jgi:predicted permease
MLVSGNYFAVLGARSAMGRVLDASDDDAGAPAPGVVLSQSFWRTVLREDSAALGRSLRIGGIEYTVAGIMPEGFNGHTATSVDVFVPFAAALRGSPGWDREAYRNVTGIVVRLARGWDRAAAEAQAGAAIDRRVFTRPLAGSDVTATEAKVAGWLGALAVLVFVIGLANAAILLLVRATRNRQEQAIRAALGASRRHLRAHALIEAIVLALVTTLLSLPLAAWMDDAMRAILFPTLGTGAGGGTVVSVTALFAGLAAAAVAFAASYPQSVRAHACFQLHTVSRAAGARRRTMVPFLLVQTTLAVLLLAGAGLFGASLHRLRSQDFGMDLDRVVVVDFDQTSTELDGQDAFFTGALARVAALPGIEAITPIDSIPFAGFNVPPISVPGRAEPPSVGQQLPFLTAATPELVRVLGIQVTEGRGFVDADDRGAPVVLVNQSMARGLWPQGSALGRCIRIGFDPDFDPESFDPSSGPPMPSDKVPCREVVGVFRDVRQRSVLPFDGEDRLMQYLVPFSQAPTPPFAARPTRIRGLLLKVKPQGGSLPSAIRGAVLGGNRDLPYLRVRPYAQLLDRQMRPWVTGTRLLGLFSALAVAVSGIGIFAAFAQSIAERRREMAIRLAMGAQPGGVRRLVLGEALAVASGGVILGLLCAITAGRGLRSLLFGTTPADPLVLAMSSGVMLLVAALATFLPAREAALADPSVLLRAE